MKKKRILDVIMLILLLFLMAYPKTGRNIHEILGLIMLICFILHHIFNWKWYQSIFRGKYSTIRKVYIVVNSLLLVNMMILILSGISMARIIPIKIIPISISRQLHMVLAYWSFILMAIHLGLHSQMMIKSMKTKLKNSSDYIKNIVFVIMPYCIAALGVVMFIKNQLISYLFMLTHFSYFDESMSIVQFLVEYMFIFALFVILTHIFIKLIQEK